MRQAGEAGTGVAALAAPAALAEYVGIDAPIRYARDKRIQAGSSPSYFRLLGNCFRRTRPQDHDTEEEAVAMAEAV